LSALKRTCSGFSQITSPISCAADTNFFSETLALVFTDRLELAKALAMCRKHKAKLVIDKLDRLSRNLAFIATMMDSGVEFVAVDSPVPE
jgi:hypothetical protein